MNLIRITHTKPTLPLPAGTWILDPSHSSLGFTIRQLGITKVRGTFTAFDARLTVGDRLADSAVDVIVSMASIDTGHAKRDHHLRSNDLLDVDHRSTMTFRSTSITGDDDRWVLEGDLAIGQVSNPMTLDVKFLGLVHHPGDDRMHARFGARGALRRKDHGLDFGALTEATVGQVVTIDLDVQLVEHGLGGRPVTASCCRRRGSGAPPALGDGRLLRAEGRAS